jgi:hypothetical protein
MLTDWAWGGLPSDVTTALHRNANLYLFINL